MNAQHDNRNEVASASEDSRTGTGARHGVSERGKSLSRTRLEKILPSLSTIVASLTPVLVVLLCATPPALIAFAGILEAIQSNQPLRALAVVTGLTLSVTISVAILYIRSLWTMGSTIGELTSTVETGLATFSAHIHEIKQTSAERFAESEKRHDERMASLERRMAVLEKVAQDLAASVESVLHHPRNSGSPRKNCSLIWQRLVGQYTGINIKLLNEVVIRPAGGGRLDVRPDLEWLDNWVRRFTDPAVTEIRIIMFTDSKSAIIAQAAGRTMLRMTCLIKNIHWRARELGESADLTKLKMYVAAAVDLQETFILATKRDTSGRERGCVYQYVASVDDDGRGSEGVVPFYDRSTVQRIRALAEQRIAASRPLTEPALLRVFGGLIGNKGACIVRALTAAEWVERAQWIERLAQRSQNLEQFGTDRGDGTLHLEESDLLVPPWEQEEVTERRDRR